MHFNKIDDKIKTTLDDFRISKKSLTDMSTEQWVTAEHVAKHLGIAKDTVYRWREHKGLPAHRVGRLWKFQLSEVDEWVRAGGADEGAAAGSEQHNEND